MRKRVLAIGATAVGFFLLLTSSALAQRTHIVQEGETLWAIAAHHGVSVETLVSANGLLSPDLLHPGQRLIIPADREMQSLSGSAAPPGAVVPAVSSVTHIVQPGDTLLAIAARYKVSVEAIVAANNIQDPDALRIGRRLAIPTAPTVAVPSAPAVPAGRMIAPSAIPSRGARWASALVNNAVRFVGIRYRWGGETPQGFDCSGFINYVMRLMGLSVPRTTDAMYASGRPVPRNQLQVGDIVFFQTVRSGPSHAGIYIGNNQFIHSSSGFGHVTVTPLDYPYYKPRYLGARRF